MKQFEGYEEYLKQSELSKQTRQVYLREAEKICPVFKMERKLQKIGRCFTEKKLREEDLLLRRSIFMLYGKSIFKIFRMRAGIYKDIKSAEKMQCGKCH